VSPSQCATLFCSPVQRRRRRRAPGAHHFFAIIEFTLDFRFFLSLFFSTPLNEFFQIQAYFITDFDCWLCYFRLLEQTFS
jgi:hypothetical protein